MSTSLTAFYPWVGYQVNDRDSVWGVIGYGTGALSLTPDGAGALDTGVSMMMSAVGTRGELIASRATDRFALVFKGRHPVGGGRERIARRPGGRLNASEVGVTRMGKALEGSRGFSLGGGRLSLTPSVEVGLRRDGGDAETGAGMDVGGGFAFSDRATGLSLDVRVRTLVVHQAKGFSERGMSLVVRVGPDAVDSFGLDSAGGPVGAGRRRAAPRRCGATRWPTAWARSRCTGPVTASTRIEASVRRRVRHVAHDQGRRRPNETAVSVSRK